MKRYKHNLGWSGCFETAALPQPRRILLLLRILLPRALQSLCLRPPLLDSRSHSLQTWTCLPTPGAVALAKSVTAMLAWKASAPLRLASTNELLTWTKPRSIMQRTASKQQEALRNRSFGWRTSASSALLLFLPAHLPNHGSLLHLGGNP